MKFLVHESNDFNDYYLSFPVEEVYGKEDSQIFTRKTDNRGGGAGGTAQ